MLRPALVEVTGSGVVFLWDSFVYKCLSVCICVCVCASAYICIYMYFCASLFLFPLFCSVLVGLFLFHFILLLFVYACLLSNERYKRVPGTNRWPEIRVRGPLCGC